MSIEVLLPVIRSQFSKLKIPSIHDKVHKDECCISFDNQFSDKGVYLNLSTFLGYGHEYVLDDSARTNNLLYFHSKFEQTRKPVEKTEDFVEPSKLAIGIEGGFLAEDKYQITKHYSLVVIVNQTFQEIQLPNVNLPEFLITITDAIIAHNGMKTQMSISTWDASSDKVISKYAYDLEQLNNNKKISNDPKTWHCELNGDTNNLWLNLSTGYIGGGRKNWDGTGGSGGALLHYEQTGRKYPLCVKLGTITPNGADVWSYSADEDNLVIDPLLSTHLKHFGIDLMKLEKTDKSFAEMEVELNQNYDWSRILESGEKLEILNDIGFVGLTNIGSSCYMNSVLQALLTIPEVISSVFIHNYVILFILNCLLYRFKRDIMVIVHKYLNHYQKIQQMILQHN